MDNLTHSLIGATLANAGLKQKWGKGTTLALIVASNIPDIDVFFGFFSNKPSFVYRRMWTHSIVGIPILCALFGFLFSRFYKNLMAWIAGGLFLIGASLHVLFDLMNSYGVVVLHPFSHRRFEFGWLFIIDLAIWSILLLPLLLALVPRFRPQLTRWSQWAAGTLTVYVLFCGAMRWRTAHWLRDMSQTYVGQEIVQATAIFPEALGPHRFRAVVRFPDNYQSFVFHPLTGQVEGKPLVFTAEMAPEVQKIRTHPEAQKLLWFFKAPVWQHEDGSDIWKVSDLRFQSAVLNRNMPFTYQFRLENEKVEFRGR